MTFTRGDVVTTDIGYGRHHYVVISGDPRNVALPSFLGVRVTTRRKPAIDSIVELLDDGVDGWFAPGGDAHAQEAGERPVARVAGDHHVVMTPVADVRRHDVPAGEGCLLYTSPSPR